MGKLRNYKYEFNMIIGTVLASLFIPFSQEVQKYFEITANSYILIIFRFSFPVLWGLYLGIGTEKYEKQKIKRCLFDIVMMIANIWIIYFYWDKSYDFSSYNLILLGILSMRLVRTLIEKNMNCSSPSK